MLTRHRDKIPRIGGLPASRRGALGLAALCALAAGVIILVALGNYRNSVKSSDRQQTVLVATSTIAKGTSGTVIALEQLAKPMPVTQSHLVPAALTDSAQLAGEIAVRQILPGQQLTTSAFTSYGGLDAQLAPDQRAISVPLDSARGDLGVIGPGDHVDVYASFNLAGIGDPVDVAGVPRPAASGNGANGSIPVVRLLVSNALVLRVPAAASGGALTGSNSGNGNVVLAVGQIQAPDLAFAIDWGKVWLTLRPANANATSQALTALETDVFGVRITIADRNGKVVLTPLPSLVPGGADAALTARQWTAAGSSAQPTTGAHQ